MKNTFKLTEGEEVIAEIKHSALPFILYFLIAVAAVALGLLFYFLLVTAEYSPVFAMVLFLIISIGGIVICVLLVLGLNSEKLILTNKRVIGRKGFLARRSTEILLNKADAVTVSNGFFGRIFKYSTVSVLTPGLHMVSNGTTVGDRYPFVVNAQEFSAAFIKEAEKFAE